MREAVHVAGHVEETMTDVFVMVEREGCFVEFMFKGEVR